MKLQGESQNHFLIEWKLLNGENLVELALKIKTCALKGSEDNEQGRRQINFGPITENQKEQHIFVENG